MTAPPDGLRAARIRTVLLAALVLMGMIAILQLAMMCEHTLVFAEQG